MRVVAAGAVPTTHLKLVHQKQDSILCVNGTGLRHVCSTVAITRSLPHAWLEFDIPHWRFEFRHRGCMKQLHALPGRPPSPSLGLLPADAIRRDSSARIHLPVELRKEDKSDPGPQIWRTGRPLPGRVPTIKPVPSLLSAFPNLIRAHRRVWRKHLGTNIGWNHPVPGDRHTAHQRGILGLLLFPAPKINRARKRRHRYELGKGYFRLQRHLRCRIER